MYVMISDEDMKILDEYQQTFKTAVESSYARHFGSKQYAALNEVFKRITGHYYKVNYGCSKCAIGFIKAIANLYFAEKDRREKAQAELEPETVTDSVPKRKPGRPKKQATNNETKSE